MNLRIAALPLAAALVALSLSACEKKIYPRGDAGVCFHVIPMNDGTLQYNVLTKNVPNMETCAANLEAMRINFVRLGSQNREIMGAYQGSFLYLVQQGVMVSQDLNAARYVALVRSGDGRLVIPGAVQRAPDPAQ